MEVVKLHPALGAEIRGVDLSKPVDAATKQAIAKAFDENIVLVFKGQTLDEPAQLAAGEIFGKVAIRKRPPGNNPGGAFDTPFM